MYFAIPLLALRNSTISQNFSLNFDRFPINVAFLCQTFIYLSTCWAYCILFNFNISLYFFADVIWKYYGPCRRQLSAVLWNIWKQNRNNIFCIKMVNFPLHWKHSASSQLTIGWQFEILYICLKSFRTETTLLEKTTSIWFQLEMDHITFGNVYLSTLGCLMENN